MWAWGIQCADDKQGYLDQIDKEKHVQRKIVYALPWFSCKLTLSLQPADNSLRGPSPSIHTR